MKIQDIIEKFDEEYPCIEFNCDGNGTIDYQVSEDEFEPQQCRYCCEIRLPFKKLLRTSCMGS